MLVNASIPSLVGGVSQQAAAVRHPSQVEEQDNFVPSLASGLRKRTGSQYIAKLAPGGDDHQFALVHTINRGTSGIAERYFVVLNNGTLKVFDFRGGQIPVAYPNGSAYLTGYFNMRDNYHCVTVADYTFITRRHSHATMTPVVAPPVAPKEFYVVVKTGVLNTNYYISLNAEQYYHSTTDALTIKSLDIALDLHDKINANVSGQFTATLFDNLIRITPRVGSGITTYNASVTDTYGGQAMFAFSDTVQRYEDLPRTFIEGPVIRVQSDPQGEAAWYVTFKDGVWTETTKPGIELTIEPDSMPHKLVRIHDGTFVFDKCEWKPRLCGDDESNPVPSFIGTSISAVFFYRNRLGLLADENVILSAAGDYFNFFGASARADLESDPIDVSASTNKVTLLRNVIPFDKSLLIFADKQQFTFASGDVLTPRNARLEPTTAFEVSASCLPAAMGRNVYFPTNRGTFSSIREYYFDGNVSVNDAVDLTAHCPSYVPTGVFKVTTAPTEEMVFVLSKEDGQRNKMWVYNTKWQGEKKVQSAWHQWVYNPTDLIVSADVFSTTLSLIVQRPDGLYLDMMELEERPYSPATFPICLDRWVGYETGTYDPGQGRTFWTLPYSLTATETPVVVLCNKRGQSGLGVTPSGQVIYTGEWRGEGGGLDPVRESSFVVSLKGNYTDTRVVIGTKFLSRCKLSQQFARNQEKDAIIVGRLQLRDMAVRFDKTGYFQAWVTPTGRSTSVYEYSGRTLGSFAMRVGIEIPEGGSFKFPIMAKSDEVDIELRSDAHTPCAFLTAETQGHLALQARR